MPGDQDGEVGADPRRGPAVLRLTERIITGQTDEIALMQSWLRDRRQPVRADPPG
jgi:uncharacterized protein (DUF305 family)